MIFGFFAVPAIYQHRVLFWGILGALAMRGAMIALGAALIAQYHWILYVFGAFLIVTGIKMLALKTDHTDPNQNIVVRLTRRIFPITARFHGQHFVVKAGAPASYESEFPGTAALPDEAVDRARPGTWMLTPLALALIMVEFTDLLGNGFNFYLLGVVLLILAVGVAVSLIGDRRGERRLTGR
jgi:tellurite resistance protein TerC